MARGVEAKAEGDALFVPAEHALPVGTRVTLRGPDGEAVYRVARVQESAAPGMMLESPEAMARKPPATTTTAAAREPVPEPVPESDSDGNDKKGKRRKRKATLT